MSPLLEAWVLPLLLLTVVLLGAIRPGAEITMAPPSLGSLVIAMGMVGLLVRSGALAPERLLSATRSALANLNGLSVLLALFAASAQAVTLVVPDSGVPAFIVWVVLVALLIQAVAIGADRTRLLRGLLVTFGTAFTLKFVILGALSAPADSPVGRVMQLLFEGITLGAVSQRPPHPAEGYLAFVTLVLYLVAIAWLPSARWQMVFQSSKFEVQSSKQQELAVDSSDRGHLS